MTHSYVCFCMLVRTCQHLKLYDISYHHLELSDISKWHKCVKHTHIQDETHHLLKNKC